MSTAEQPATPAPARRSRLWLRAAVIVGLFAGSFLLSSYGHLLFAPTENADEPAASTPDTNAGRSEPHARPSASEPAADRLDRAERYFRELNHAAALAMYKTLLAEAGDPARGALHYRIAQCQEALGNWDKALAAYRQAASDEALDAGRAAAQLGKARVLIRLERHDEAKALLYPLVLTSAAPTASLPVVTAARHWLALVLSRTAMPKVLPGQVATLALGSRYSADLGPDLAVLRQAARIRSGKATGLPEAIAINQESSDKEKRVRQASFRSLGAHDLFDVIAKTGGLRLEWTDAARKATADRSLGLAVQQWPLADLVMSVADCLGLVCRLDGEQVRLATPAEVSAEARQAFQLDLARRAGRAALAVGADNPVAPAVVLHLGNLEAAVGDTSAAVTWYDRLLHDKPASPLAVPASFNRGVVYLRRGEYGTARHALFRALDLAPAHELAPLALLHIGRTCLEEGDLKRGLTLLRRGRTMAAGAEVQPRLTLMLAAGLLLANEPRAAHDVLLQDRPRFKQETVRATAALLDAMGRYRAVRAAGPARSEAADLIAALAQERDPDVLGPLEAYLCCRSLRELGMWDRIVALCAHALPRSQGPMAAALVVAQGDALLHLKKPAEATRLFQQVAQGKEGPWVAAARFHLAALDLEAGRAGECATRCAQIWSEQRFADMPALLLLWGRAYEQLGENDKAARCFAGSPPE